MAFCKSILVYIFSRLEVGIEARIRVEGEKVWSVEVEILFPLVNVFLISLFLLARKKLLQMQSLAI